MNNITLKDKF